MLASDRQDGAPPALKFSLASDIVELVVLTTDALFLQTMREAVAGARRLWHVATGDKVGDLLVAGEVGIVVLDVNALLDSASVFVAQIKKQFPDLVVVAAGSRDDETSLARLISAGTVYRFIHKPVSPGRARLFVETAVKKYSEQLRRRTPPAPAATAPRVARPALIVGGLAGALLLGTAAWLSRRHAGHEDAMSLPANGDRGAQSQQAEPAAAGLAEARERLLSRAENALLEERLDEAASAIETARLAGVEPGRIAFLSAQLVKGRERLKVAQAQARGRAAAAAAAKLQADASITPNGVATPGVATPGVATDTTTPGRAADAPPVTAPAAPTAPTAPKQGAKDPSKITPLLELAAQRMSEGHLAEPEGDSARFYVQQALQLAPEDDAVLDAKQKLAAQLLSAARSAMDRHDFSAASGWLKSAEGIASPVNIDAGQSLLAGSRAQADSDARGQLLKNANERLLQDRLIEPVNDNAKYYLLALKSLDPSSPALAPSMQDLGNRLIAKARRAIMLKQYDAARSWLDEADGIGFGAADSAILRNELASGVAHAQWLNTFVPPEELKLRKSVQPEYPATALKAKLDGWVELDLTIGEKGEVRDVSVHANSTPILFDAAAIKAVSQWRYEPVLVDTKPVACRTRIRVRFSSNS